MPHIYITGAAGFVGSHAAERFIELGWKVTAVDNFITGRQDNLKEMMAHPCFAFYDSDVSLPLPESRLGPVDAVLHLACPASPRDYLKHPVETMKAGSLGTFHTLDLARRHQARYVLASTSEIYGDPEVHPQREDYWGHVNPVGPRAVYNEAKRFAEALVMAHHREYGLDTVILRFFNTYGPRMNPEDGRIIPNFAMQALEGRPLTVYGDGSQTRSFCYIADLVEGIVRSITEPQAIGEVMNLGNPAEYTVRDMADILLRLTGHKGTIEHLPPMEDDPKRRRPDISKAKRLLKWEPAIGLEEGLRRTLDYFAAYARGGIR
ncbi:UDP-glucuronic acid decarboxylase family protein [Paenibacillus silviterrae]|uniref:UDP-glucuronic acid decarboxylase family protein n=1 Tax=Paenibacillus silviterrae TaxID=3242194 RepID=UPI0025435FCF|nr:UDP-glucuronic acid decarboxylase family protein [Paenibacillus chinjuensis]